MPKQITRQSTRIQSKTTQHRIAKVPKNTPFIFNTQKNGVKEPLWDTT